MKVLNYRILHRKEAEGVYTVIVPPAVSHMETQ